MSAFIWHETRNPDHTVLVFGRTARVQGSTIDMALTRQCEQEAKRATEGDVALEAQIRTMYSIVKSGQRPLVSSTPSVSSRPQMALQDLKILDAYTLATIRI